MSMLPITPDALRMLAKVMAETGLTEVELTDGDRRVRVVRAPQAPVVAAAPQAIALAAPAAPPAALAPPPAPAAPAAGAVLSPMLGIAYLTPEPDAPPFVQVGQTVREGDTLLLIEAMKTFNPIQAPRAGRVARIDVGSGDMVEKGQVLLVIA